MPPLSPALLLLDLDETLIIAKKDGLDRPPDFRCDPFGIYVRPYLDQFFAQVRRSYRLAVWTASTRSYMECVVPNVFPDDLELHFAWARERCTRVVHPEFRTEGWVKDLKKVKRRGESLDRVLMVDDTASKLRRNYGNLIRIRPWNGGLDDEELLHLAPYLLEISDTESFRTLKKRPWRADR